MKILDYRQTRMGDLMLRRRTMMTLDNIEIYEVKLGEEFLMSSLFYEAEEELSRLGLSLLDGENWDVAVGGLGLGYTAVAALKFDQLKSLVIVDAMPAVIEWHEQELVPLGKTMNADPRCRYVHGDFFAMLSEVGEGLDPEQPKRKFDAILLDVDHTPRHQLDASHRPFYSVEGLKSMKRSLKPGGVFAMWSDDPEDSVFMESLREVFDTVENKLITFYNPITDKDSRNSIYLAR